MTDAASPSALPASKPKNTAVVLLRVLGMLMIILCHIIQYYTFIPGSQVLGQVFNVGVKVFLLISGYLYGGKIIQRFGSWMGQRFLKIALPVVILALLDTAALALAGSEEAVGITTVLPYLFCLHGLPFIVPVTSDWIQEMPGIGPVWFVTVILFCYALVPLLQFIKTRAKEKNVPPYVLVLAVSLGFLVTLVLELLTDIRLDYFMVFAAGYLLGDFGIGQKKKIGTPCFLILTVVMLAFQALRLVMRSRFDGTSLYILTVFFAQNVLGGWIVVFIFWLYNVAPKFVDAVGQSRFMAWLDKMSFFIYMVHGIFCTGSTFNMYTLIGNIGLSSLAFLGCTIAAALVLYGLHTAVMKLIGLISASGRKKQA